MKDVLKEYLERLNTILNTIEVQENYITRLNDEFQTDDGIELFDDIETVVELIQEAGNDFNEAGNRLQKAMEIISKEIENDMYFSQVGRI